MKRRLIKYLSSYRVAVARLEDLRQRRARIAATIDPMHGLNYDGMPKSTTVTDGMDRVVTAIDKLAEIDKELRSQEEAAKDYAAEILDTISKLPEGSDGRRALELRFIDGATTLEAADKLAVSSATYWRVYNRALTALLDDPGVKAKIENEEV